VCNWGEGASECESRQEQCPWSRCVSFLLIDLVAHLCVMISSFFFGVMDGGRVGI
jgi:hypothetical protein